MNNTICVVICGMLTIVEKMLNGQDLIVSGFFGNYFLCICLCWQLRKSTRTKPGRRSRAPPTCFLDQTIPSNYSNFVSNEKMIKANILVSYTIHTIFCLSRIEIYQSRMDSCEVINLSLFWVFFVVAYAYNECATFLLITLLSIHMFYQQVSNYDLAYKKL